MTLNGVPVISYNVDNTNSAYIILQTDSDKTALAAITPTMTFMDGTGLPVFILHDFNKVLAVEYTPDTHLYKINIAQKTNFDGLVDNLQAENTLLRAQVTALTDRNDFTDDCIAEMAMLVYA